MPKLSQLPESTTAFTQGDYIVGVKLNGDGSVEDVKYGRDQLPVGPKGDTGATGPTGPQGATGATGAKGDRGDTGLQGEQGIQGVPGPVGPAGLNWKGSWVQGSSYVVDDAIAYGGSTYFCIMDIAVSAGTPDTDTTHFALLAAQGAKGDTGAQGIQGATGPQGQRGVQGLQGLQGAQGATGPQGSTGATGAQGPQGVPGADAAPHSLLTVYGNGGRINTISIGSSAGSGYALNNQFNISGGAGLATGKISSISTAGDGNAVFNAVSNSSGQIVSISISDGGLNYVSGVYYETESSGIGSGCILLVTSVSGAGAILAASISNGGSGYGANRHPSLYVNSKVIVTGIQLLTNGYGYSTGTNIATSAITGSGSGLTINVDAVSPPTGPMITDSFFSNTILQITFGNAVYMVNQDFTQTGTTITATNPALLFSQYGTQIIAWS